MSLTVIRTRDAITDELEISTYFGERQGFAALDRFLKIVRQAYDHLAEMPGMGTRRDYGNPRYANMRVWPVPEYRKYLIFYRVEGDTLKILRVMHGAQDLEAFFGLPEDESK